MDLFETFGYQVRRRRKAQDLTQEDLARRVGCSPATIRKIEGDMRRPSRQIAGLLARELGLQGQEEQAFLQLARATRSSPALGRFAREREIKKSIANVEATEGETNLPRPLTSFIGREQEIARLSQLLAGEDCRLITLLGPGGIGKTRLAVQLAQQMKEQQPGLFPDGVFFLPLVEIESSELVPAAIAEALRIRLSNQREPKQQVLNCLGKKRLLIVLDNMEHLPGGAGLVMEILQCAPEVKLLVTSRERLKLQCEWVFEVQGLPVPGQPDRLEGSSSAALFVERARRLLPGFALQTENAEAIARICRLVEGMPLGIELAATWVRTLSVDEIAQEIENNLDFLSSQTRDLPARQQSLRAVFDTSWRLLSAEEQKVMRRIAVLRGGFRRDAAEQVAGASVSILAGLLEKSLVRRGEDGRYSLHNLVSQYAMRHLREQPEEEAETRAFHSAYFLEWIKAREASLVTERQKQARDEITAELGNLRAAWEWALAQRRFGLIRQAAFAVVRYHEFTNQCQAGETLLSQAIEAYQAFLDEQAGYGLAEKRTLGVLLGHASFLTFRIGQNEKAQEMIERSLGLLREEGCGTECLTDLAEVLWHMGSVYWFSGRYEQAARLSEEGLALYQKLGWKWEAAVQEICTGGVLIAQGKYEEALRVLKHALTLSRETREPRLISTAIGILCRTLEVFQHYAEMQALLRESAEISRETHDQFALGMALERLAAAAQAAGAAEEAIQLFQEAIVIFREIGDGWSLAHTLIHLGQLYVQLGSYDLAAATYQEGYRSASAAQANGCAIEAQVGMAEVIALQGDSQAAARMAAAAVESPAATYEARRRT